jgi:hypothetical protein
MREVDFAKQKTEEENKKSGKLRVSLSLSNLAVPAFNSPI